MLANLPVELLVKIFDELDVFALSSCKYVNRSFNNVIRSSSLLQYNLELGLAGVEANPTCTLRLSECLEAVRSYRRDWEKLAWSSAGGWRKATGNISHHRGAFILGEGFTGGEDGSQYRLKTQRFQPKSKHRRLEERTWSEDRPAIIFTGADPSQDLLLAMPDEGVIHILSFSTFQPYPNVARPIIYIPVEGDSSVEVDIYGSHLVASTHIHFTFKFEKSIYVYNWRTGRIFAEISYPCDNFFLLTEKLVACYVTKQRSASRPAHFAIFRIPGPENPTPSEPTPLMRTPSCIFNLPHPTGGKDWYLTQGTTNSSYGSCPPPKDSSVPFYSSGKRLLLSLWLLASQFSRSPACSLVIPLRTLLNHIPSEPTPSATVFDWDVWGPTGSRLLAGSEARHMSLQFGWKIARLGPPDLSTVRKGTPREVGITVYDFNPLPFHGPPDAAESGKKTPQELEPEAGERSRLVVTSPSFCPNPLELDGVQTSLPYCKTFAPFETHGPVTNSSYYEISLGEDGIVVWSHLTLDYVVLAI